MVGIVNGGLQRDGVGPQRGVSGQLRDLGLSAGVPKWGLWREGRNVGLLTRGPRLSRGDAGKRWGTRGVKGAVVGHFRRVEGTVVVVGECDG